MLSCIWFAISACVVSCAWLLVLYLVHGCLCCIFRAAHNNQFCDILTPIFGIYPSLQQWSSLSALCKTFKIRPQMSILKACLSTLLVCVWLNSTRSIYSHFYNDSCKSLKIYYIMKGISLIFDVHINVPVKCVFMDWFSKLKICTESWQRAWQFTQYFIISQSPLIVYVSCPCQYLITWLSKTY